MKDKAFDVFLQLYILVCTLYLIKDRLGGIEKNREVER